MANILIGTSGWSYKEWGNSYYPPELAPRDWLKYLSREFPTVELNSSFYRLPDAATFAKWHDETPDGFVFAVKVSRLITHIKRLNGAEENWEELRRRSGRLGPKLGPFLLQFPRSFAANRLSQERLNNFLAQARRLHPEDRLACEFRHPSCFGPAVLAILERHQAALVLADSGRFPSSPANFSPADFVYIRLHGPEKLYASGYSDRALRDWASRASDWQQTGRDVFIYFDNDSGGFALHDAQKLSRLVASKL